MKIHTTIQQSRMIPADITVEITEAGRVIPWCQAAYDYCEFAGAATFSKRQLALLKKRGHQIHVRQAIVEV
jgi:hypothetical protein